ncbi:hypothetical protein MASR1M31_04560 [Porphyromonadaceae bacterium]
MTKDNLISIIDKVFEMHELSDDLKINIDILTPKEMEEIGLNSDVKVSDQAEWCLFFGDQLVYLEIFPDSSEEEIVLIIEDWIDRIS